MTRHFSLLRDAGAANEGAAGQTANSCKGEVSKEQVTEWKTRNPLGIYAIKVGGHIAYFRMPGFDELNFGYSKLDRDKMLDLWKAFAEVTFLGGSDEVFKNATLFAGAMKLIQKKVDGAEAELVNL
jgi:hypothetical protein